MWRYVHFFVHSKLFSKKYKFVLNFNHLQNGILVKSTIKSYKSTIFRFKYCDKICEKNNFSDFLDHIEDIGITKIVNVGIQNIAQTAFEKKTILNFFT